MKKVCSAVHSMSGVTRPRMRGAHAGENLGERLHLSTRIDARILIQGWPLDARSFDLQAGPSARERRVQTYSSRRAAAQVNDSRKNEL